MLDNAEVIRAANLAYNAIADLAIVFGRVDREDALYWGDLAPEEREEFLVATRHALANRFEEAEIRHRNWLRQAQRDGWADGSEHCEEKKTSPLVRAWESLSPYERIRMRLFLRVVRTVA